MMCGLVDIDGLSNSQRGGMILNKGVQAIVVAP